ncbi:MAG: energy transducer TonB [Pedobacter sp.]|nr:energy transducer TonB [Pedobacter sp.]
MNEPLLKTMINTSSNLYKAEWLNLVFKNRNQAYGAYALRSESGRISMWALFFGSAVFVLLFMAPKLYSLFQKDEVVAEPYNNEKIVDVILPPKVEKPKVKEELLLPKNDPINEKIKMVKPMSRPTPVNDTPPFTPPTIEEMDHAVVGPVTQVGKETDLIVAPTEGAGNGTEAGTVSGEGSGTEEEIYNAIDIEAYPEFEGGMKAWYKFIQRNLRYPTIAIEQEKQGKVFVSFVIERDGSVSDVKVMKGVGYGMDDEAARVIKKSPIWKPGKQSGKPVRVRFNMPITFAMGL